MTKDVILPASHNTGRSFLHDHEDHQRYRFPQNFPKLNVSEAWNDIPGIPSTKQHPAASHQFCSSPWWFFSFNLFNEQWLWCSAWLLLNMNQQDWLYVALTEHDGVTDWLSATKISDFSERSERVGHLRPSARPKRASVVISLLVPRKKLPRFQPQQSAIVTSVVESNDCSWLFI